MCGKYIGRHVSPLNLVIFDGQATWNFRLCAGPRHRRYEFRIRGELCFPARLSRTPISASSPPSWRSSLMRVATDCGYLGSFNELLDLLPLSRTIGARISTSPVMGHNVGPLETRAFSISGCVRANADALFAIRFRLSRPQLSGLPCLRKS